MNFYSIRFIFIILVYIFMNYLYKKSKIKENNKKKLYRMIFIIIIILSFLVIPEKLFLKFNKLESAFKYSLPIEKIFHKIEIEDYSFAIYQKDDNKEIIYFKKENNKYLFNSRDIIHSYIRYKTYTILIKQIKNTNNYFIYIDSANSNESIEVKDTLKNEYIECYVDNKYNYYYFIKNIPEHYYVIINHNKVKIK